LAPGSYRLVLGGAELARVHAPFTVARGERVVIDVSVPRADAVPEGFVFVPAGTFLFGDDDERLRRGVLDAAPLHRRNIRSFLIARRETTFREWLGFLDSLTPAERRRYTPRASAPSVSVGTRGALQLSETTSGWRLAFQPAGTRYEALAGQRIEYAGRRRRRTQDWLERPVLRIGV